MVFLHGLFGSSNNWRYMSNSDFIKNRRNSIFIDLRNHGDSDHHDSMTYEEMADDVIRHLDILKIDKFTLLGHSMGAKTSMHIATKVQNRLDGLIILDAAPKCHKDNINIYGNIKGIIDKLSEIDLYNQKRSEIVNYLREIYVKIIIYINRVKQLEIY
jgi:esterase